MAAEQHNTPNPPSSLAAFRAPGAPMPAGPVRFPTMPRPNSPPGTRGRLAARARLEALIERAIAALDELDGDPDLEPEVDCCAAGDDDPQYEAPSRAWAIGSEDDAEPDADFEPDDEDGCPADEPRFPVTHRPPRPVPVFVGRRL
jgi:hypothetical protein